MLYSRYNIPNTRARGMSNCTITEHADRYHFDSPTLDISVDKSRFDFDLLNFILKAILQAELVHQHVIILHGACLIAESTAFGFIGPSGSGKSTLIANAYVSPDLSALSEDTLIIKNERGKYRCHHSPFDYKLQPPFSTKVTQINEIYVLEKFITNTTCKLHLQDKIKNLMKNNIYTMLTRNINTTTVKDTSIQLVHKQGSDIIFQAINEELLNLLGVVRIKKLRFTKDYHFTQNLS